MGDLPAAAEVVSGGRSCPLCDGRETTRSRVRTRYPRDSAGREARQRPDMNDSPGIDAAIRRLEDSQYALASMQENDIRILIVAYRDAALDRYAPPPGAPAQA